MLEVVVIGGGPAGMSAALVAGRGKKEVLLIDEELPRNRVTQEAHAFLTRDGVTPEQFREKGRRDLSKYPTIKTENARIVSIDSKLDHTFELKTETGETVQTRAVVLAIGFKETLPAVKNIESYYGKSLFSCPFCDGWEMQDCSLILIIDTKEGAHLPTLLNNWSEDLIVATNGMDIFDAQQKKDLKLNQIRLIDKEIVELKGENGALQSVVFEDGEEVIRTGGFCTPTINQNFPFVEELGLEVNEAGFVSTDSMGRTNIKGIYAAGEITGPSQLIVSASHGHMAGVGIIFDYSASAYKKN
ncbi:NAD(P)/FAD-dependent oxidoreductase [Marinilactibacillus sp. Marseille-P9653]|uniref:NAD(P)/FAD-dependent oxidoreductase n=1 Tax=Marinilactibacillus sp. Marseille-P9653 TaxID=2866583 RepID=UPI001CE44BF3|nr:NAD(P)/FAD-dependent oxidoreductase [Marinilactibacillus sp. Marseille-P9653]